jgi:hypothetical protein
MLDQQFPVPSATNGPVAPESRQPERPSLAIPLGVLTVATGMLTGLGAKRHLADLRARSGLTTEQLIYAGRAAGWLVVPNLEPS